MSLFKCKYQASIQSAVGGAMLPMLHKLHKWFFFFSLDNSFFVFLIINHIGIFDDIIAFIFSKTPFLSNFGV